MDIVPSVDTLVVRRCIPQHVTLNDSQFNELWEQHPKELGRVMIADSVISTPRWQQSYLRSYQFTGMDHAALDTVPAVLLPLKRWVDEELGYGSFNQVFVNWYADGSHYIGPHSDDTTQLVPGSPIVSVSFGASRVFRIHSRRGGPKIKDYTLRHGDCIVMLSPMQQHYKHSIVKVGGRKATTVGRRINVTFRKFL